MQKYEKCLQLLGLLYKKEFVEEEESESSTSIDEEKSAISA
jgi:hypothetical protein